LVRLKLNAIEVLKTGMETFEGAEVLVGVLTVLVVLEKAFTSLLDEVVEALGWWWAAIRKPATPIATRIIMSTNLGSILLFFSEGPFGFEFGAAISSKGVFKSLNTGRGEPKWALGEPQF
jgi:hypothetical protein